MLPVLIGEMTRRETLAALGLKNPGHLREGYLKPLPRRRLDRDDDALEAQQPAPAFPDDAGGRGCSGRSLIRPDQPNSACGAASNIESSRWMMSAWVISTSAALRRTCA